VIEPGTVIDDRYLVERTLASGGMGTVLVVRHQTLDSLHALKILHVPGQEVRERLITEGKVQARLRHPNIVAVTDTLTYNGAPGIVMEFIGGGCLDDLLAERTLSLDEIESLFLGILAGVAYAHDQGLVHRDLKPANVLIERLGQDGLLPKVTDFGIVKVLEDARPVTGAPRTRTGIGMGTPQYMAPEQADGASRVGPEADVFSLGCILYEMVLGARPFESQSVLGILASAADGLYDDPQDLRADLPERFVQAIRGALVPERELRIATCEELAAVLTEGRVTSLANRDRRSDRPPTPPPKRAFPRGQGRVENHRRRRSASIPAPRDEADSQTWSEELAEAPPTPVPEPGQGGSGGGRGWLVGLVASGVVLVVLALGIMLAVGAGVGVAGVAWMGMGGDTGTVDTGGGTTDPTPPPPPGGARPTRTTPTGAAPPRATPRRRRTRAAPPPPRPPAPPPPRPPAPPPPRPPAPPPPRPPVRPPPRARARPPRAPAPATATPSGPCA